MSCLKGLSSRRSTTQEARNSNPPAGNRLQSPASSAPPAQAAAPPYSATAPFPPPQAPSVSSASASASSARLASSASSVSSSSASVKTNSSYFDCHGVPSDNNNPKGRDWHYAQDVKAQAQQAPPPKPSGRGYPSHFGNKGPNPLPLSANGRLTHTPIKDGTSQPYKRGPPGAHRVVYNDNDRSTVNVIYHDPTKPGLPGSRSTQFSMASYVPKRNT
ncbi:Guanine-specific ribonuclease N1/T1 [Penicillium camemberti]|uniref:Guanine-specific ribonuclease N1/T1 n=1 Tax=Penicillium camemberti (strain FM 013) TaxID=1429867 RepID=A0A0G4P2J0_PENC3|nr:Guanine-specific ribonuclease N1/T1 [Penicillium camemberti]